MNKNVNILAVVFLSVIALFLSIAVPALAEFGDTPFKNRGEFKFGVGVFGEPFNKGGTTASSGDRRITPEGDYRITPELDNRTIN